MVGFNNYLIIFQAIKKRSSQNCAFLLLIAHCQLHIVYCLFLHCARINRPIICTEKINRQAFFIEQVWPGSITKSKTDSYRLFYSFSPNNHCAPINLCLCRYKILIFTSNIKLSWLSSFAHQPQAIAIVQTQM